MRNFFFAYICQKIRANIKFHIENLFASRNGRKCLTECAYKNIVTREYVEYNIYLVYDMSLLRMKKFL